MKKAERFQLPVASHPHGGTHSVVLQTRLPTRLPQLAPSSNYLNEWKKPSWREDVLLAQKSN